MPRNGSGTMSVLNSFSAGSTISSSSVNGNFTDLASEITNSLPRDGQAAMTGQLKAASGTAAAPGMCWGSDTDTGFRRSAANTTMAVSNGSDVAAISDTGLAMQTGMTITDQGGLVVAGMPTGCMMPFLAATAPTGWVLASGRTIGNASSAATERANADTSLLFTFLWTNLSNTVCPVSSGRGVSAAADYAANKTITLPDLRGRAFFGLDDLGGTAASRVTTAGSSVDGTTLGASGGTQNQTLAASQIPDLGISVSPSTSMARITGSTVTVGTGSSFNVYTSAAIVPATQTVSYSSGSTPVVTLPPAFLGAYIIKL